MTDPRWTTVDGLFEAALERNPDERSAFLREACAGHETLRQEVESLLAHASGAKGFLERPAVALVGPTPTEERQSLVGRQFGSHRIVSLLGTGGMGEVYRAHDTTLGRDVAIKMLPPLFTTDPERRARFDREARLLAALNHPRVAAIYGIDNIDGTPALILELVDGDTLAARIANGPLPVSEALTVARQIAEALEAAHEKGIVHRDLKPANIKITPHGAVKVLDFGLAKATSGDTSAPDLTQSPTSSVAGTRDGVILGTAAYMSPEQARGKAVDKRTDIWAFGCVLYEMLSGRALFARDTVTDTLAAIVERDPDWQALPPATPGKVRELLRRSLQKDPQRRLRDIGDARLEIEDYLQSGGADVSAPSMPSTGSLRTMRVAWSIAALAALIAAGALTWAIRSPRQPETPAPRVSRTVLPISRAAALAINNLRSLAITRDGSRIVYVGNNDGLQLFVHALDRLEPTAIFTASRPLNWICLSPDSQWVAFVEGFQLKKVAMTGGPAVTLAAGMQSQGATWLPDDTIVMATNDPATGLQRVSAAGGDVTVLTRPARDRGELDHVWPERLPGGRVLFTITAVTGGLEAAQIAVLDLATGTHKVVVRGGSHAHYVPTGHLVYAVGSTLRAIQFDVDRLETLGEPSTVINRLVTKPGGSAEFAIADNGTLVYADGPVAIASLRTLVWVDRQGSEEPLPAPPRAYFQPRISPDGNRVAVTVTRSGVWVWNLQSRSLNGPLQGWFPAWARDGRLFLAGSPGTNLLTSQFPDAGGAPETLASHASAGLFPSDVTQDDARLIYSQDSQGGFDLMALALDGTNRVETLLQTPFTERNGIVSPDRRWLAYESDSSGLFQIYVRPFPNVNAGEARLISTDGGTRPLWSPSGRELFYVAPDGALMSVVVSVEGRDGPWSAGSPGKVVDGPYLTAGPVSGRTYDISPNGQRFLMVKRPAGEALPQIIVVQQWLEELERLVPTVNPGS